MSTLGFGDITFHTDAGRAFSILVLMSGIVLLLIVLPFAFIRFFYAPWLEAQLRLRAPREAPRHSRPRGDLPLRRDRAGFDRSPEGSGHPYYVIEPDLATKAAELHANGVSVVAAEADSKATYDDSSCD